MKVTDASGLLNTSAKQFAGFTAVVNEDLSNVVDFGRSIEDSMGYDVFFGKLVDQFNTIRFWARPHVSFAPSLYMEPEKFGAIRGMYRTGYMKMVSDPAWHLENGVSYDPFVVNKQKVDARFWSGRIEAMVEPQTIVREQIESAFRSEGELMQFIGMLEMARDNTYQRAYDDYTMMLIQAAIAMANNAGGMQVISLLTEYNAIATTPLTATNAMYDEGFIRYAIYRMGVIRDQMRLTTGLFNSTHYEEGTPPDRQRTIMVSDFARAAGVYLHDAPNQFNTGNLGVPNHDVVPAWQGLGTTGALVDRMKVNVNVTIDGNLVTGEVTNVLAIVHDEWTMGLTAYRHKVTSQWNPLGEYTNIFDKMFGGYFVSPDENCVIFRLA